MWGKVKEMKKVLIIACLLSLSCLAKTEINNLVVYYPKDFQPYNCLAWKEKAQATCEIIISCYGKQGNEDNKTYSLAGTCKAVKYPFSIRYQEGTHKNFMYIEKDK